MNKLSQFLGAAAVVIIALVFVLQFRPASDTSLTSKGPNCAIEIQGECIPVTHFWAAYRLLAPRGADADRLRAMGHRRRTSDGLVERWLLNNDAKRLGITVSDEDLSTELGSGRAYVSLPVGEGPPNNFNDNFIHYLNVRNRQTKKFEKKTYEKEVRLASQLSPTEFREFERQEMIAARMRDLIRSRAHVGEAEAFALYDQEKSTATLGYIKLDSRFYADIVADSSDKAVDAWADSNKEEVDKVWESRKPQFTPECRVTRQIFVAIPEEGTDEQKVNARKAIDDAKARLDKGEDFAVVAEAVSQQEETARKGGAMGCVGKGRNTKTYDEALFALEEGKTSGVVETESGFYIMKVERVAKDADAEKIGRRQTARELYLKHEGERLAAQAAKEILAAARGGKSLDDALKAHLDAALPKPKEDKKGDKKADKKADKKVEGDAKAEEVAKTPAQIAAEKHPYRPVVQATLPFNVGGDPISDVKPGEQIARKAFDLAKPGDVPNDVIPLESGYAVIQLKEKSPASKEQWEKDRDGFIQTLRAHKEHDVLIAYVKRLRAKLGAEIKISPDFQNEPKVKPTEGEDVPPMPEDLGGGE